MSDKITVVVPTIPTRSELLYKRALPSISAQTRPADAIAISVDAHRQGAWVNRNNGVNMVNTTWTAFLDDDDELLPHHLDYLLSFANEKNADVVWGWFTVMGGSDPFPGHRGRQWDVEQPHIFPITTLIRTELIRDSKAEFMGDPDSTGNWLIQDFPFWKAIHDAGGKFQGSQEITWKWWHHVGNTSGVPSRW